MKKLLIVTLMLSLTLIFAVGCTPDEEEVAPPPVVEEIALDSEELLTFIDVQNEGLAPLNSDAMTIVVRAEGSALIYTHIFGPYGFSDDEIQEMFDKSLYNGDGDMLLQVAQMTVPEITTVTIEYVDTDGNILHTQDFN